MQRRGRRARLGRLPGCVSECVRAAGRNGSAQMKQQMGGREWDPHGSLGNFGRRLQHCVELVPVPTTDLQLEITRKGPLRCVRWLPPAFENVSPNVRSKPSKPSKHSRASTHRYKNALTFCYCLLLVGRVHVLIQCPHLTRPCRTIPPRTRIHDLGGRPAGSQPRPALLHTYRAADQSRHASPATRQV